MSRRGVPGNGAVGGFATTGEIKSIRIDEKHLAPHSMPPEILSFKPDASAAVKCFKDGTQERRLFSNVDLTEAEMQSVRCLQQEAHRQGASFSPLVASWSSRYAARNPGNAKRALKEMIATQEWRQKYFEAGPITPAVVEDDMKHGIIYFCGRDHQFRPALIIRPGRIPSSWYKRKESSRLLRLLVFSLEYMLHYLDHPGKVETCSIIFDLKDLGASHLQHQNVLQDLCKVLSAHYIYRVHSFSVCNMPSSMCTVTKWMANRFLTERQQEKIKLIKRPEELHQEFALHQLEEDLGGTRPMITQFFPFPLQAGPFTAGCSTGPHLEVPMHLASTTSALQEHVGNARLSKQGSTNAQHSELTIIFRRSLSMNSNMKMDAGTEQVASTVADEPTRVQNEQSSICSESTCAFSSELHSTSDCSSILDGTSVPDESRLLDMPISDAHRWESAHVTRTAVEIRLRSDSEVRPQEEVSSLMEDSEVRPRGFFSCMMCHVAKPGKL